MAESGSDSWSPRFSASHTSQVCSRETSPSPTCPLTLTTWEGLRDQGTQRSIGRHRRGAEGGRCGGGATSLASPGEAGLAPAAVGSQQGHSAEAQKQEHLSSSGNQRHSLHLEHVKESLGPGDVARVNIVGPRDMLRSWDILCEPLEVFELNGRASSRWCTLERRPGYRVAKRREEGTGLLSPW